MTQQTEPIKREKHKLVYLNFLGGISDISARSIVNVCSLVMANEKPETLYFLFSSNGGSIDASITLYNLLRSLPTQIVMHNIGSIDSAANIIFLAGAKRYASRLSAFHFHGVHWTFPSGGIDPPPTYRPQIAEALSSIDSGESLMSEIIVEQTKLTTDETKTLFAQGAKRTPDFALSKGIIHEVRDPSIPKDALVIPIPEK